MTNLPASHVPAVTVRHARQYRAWLRAQAPCAKKYFPIVVVDGNRPPTREGTGYYWVTPNGNVCHHPRAYRRAFGRPIYCASTARVEVGRQWLIARAIPERAMYPVKG